MYDTPLWRARRLQQLQHYPLCAACLQDNIITAATVVHHTQDHKGNWDIFMGSPLESLCKRCHDNIRLGSEVLGYQRGCDVFGAPYKTNPIFIDKNRGKRRGA
jgi:5-methylcytosine-specific restriction enzyme A